MNNKKNEPFIIKYLDDVKKQLDDLDIGLVSKFIEILHQAYKNDKTVFVIGNGGSATTAIHFSCDMGKGTVKNINDHKEKRFKVIPLPSNIATLTAIANDISYDDIFSQQLVNFMKQGDVLIAISASGNSKNIIKAVKVAKEGSLVVLGLAGFDGGMLKNLSDHCIVVKNNNYGVVEDIHHILSHIINLSLKEIK